MASGKEHLRFNIRTIIITAFISWIALSFYEILDIRFMYFFIAAIAGSIWLSPDLDQNNTISDKAWLLLHKFWDFYAGFFKHRGMSHWPIVGTLTRLGYILVWWSIFCNLHHIYGEIKRIALIIYENKLYWFAVAGVEYSSLLHIFKDITHRKKKKN